MLLQLLLLPFHTTRSTFGPPFLNIPDISDITQYFDKVKSSSISQLIKSKPRDLQELLKYLSRITTSASSLLLLLDVLPINNFVL